MTSINAAVETSLAKITAIGENIARLQEEARSERQAALEPLLEALAASGEVSLIAIWGYTPGFNDGEPCTHSATWIVNIDEGLDNDVFELGIGLEDDFDWTNELPRHSAASAAEICRSHGHVYGQPSKEILEAISNVIFDTAEEENGTDYYVTYVLKDGVFVKDEGEYECGH